ncbi:MAG: hypothetical protein ACYTGZ_20085 [Planctomycetota bacterium]|jgi:hypothetical protein
MSTTITVRDETASGNLNQEFTLELMASTVDVREIIRSRVYQEVQDFNRKRPALFRGLVQPTEAERELNGYRVKKARKVNWETQFNKAIEAFQGNGFLLLVDDRQLTDLDEEVKIGVDTRVSFVKLIPLVGG